MILKNVKALEQCSAPATQSSEARSFELGRRLLNVTGQQLTLRNCYRNSTLLNCWTAEEQSLALEAAANEIAPEQYVGTHPPQKAYEEVCVGAELFAFLWKSKHFGGWMYFKFCFVKDTFFVVSIHEDKRRGKEETT
jgi:hypothetical protein